MGTTHPTLYRRDTKGRLRVWYMRTDDLGSYRTFDGLEDGAHKASDWTLAKPKNVGKTNQTTAEEQALKEVRAQYDKQLARKWHRTRECNDWKPPFPMLAEKASEFPVEFPPEGTIPARPLGYVQPKLDGVRCLAFLKDNKVTFWSREGQQFPEFPAIKDDIEAFLRVYPDVVLDGELYNHEFKEDFNAIVSAVKNGKKVTEAGILQYHVYDYISPAKEPFSYRHWWLSEHFPIGRSAAKLVPTLPVFIEQGYKLAYENFLEAGYEGMMFRYDMPYEMGKRSKSLLKVKDFMDEEFEFLNVNEGTGNYTGCAKSATFRMKDGREFNAQIKGPKAKLQAILANPPLLGAWATVKFFRYTPAGIPRFPTVKQFWEGKRDV